MSIIDCKFDIKPLSQLKKERNLTPELQKAFDAEVARKTDEYVPMLTGTLKNSVKTGSLLGGGFLVYNEPYAKKQYYGGRAPGKSQTGALRGRLWFERMKIDCGEELAQFLSKKTGGKFTKK